MAGCSAFTANSLSRCANAPGEGSELCAVHDPTRKARQQAMRERHRLEAQERQARRDLLQISRGELPILLNALVARRKLTWQTLLEVAKAEQLITDSDQRKWRRSAERMVEQVALMGER